jgi:hypothetical protein
LSTTDTASPTVACSTFIPAITSAVTTPSAEKLGGADALLDLEPHPVGADIAGAGPRGAGAAALLGHRRLEPGRVHAPALLAQRILRQIEREAVGVVELERHVAGQLLALAELFGLLGEQPEAAVQHRLEARFLQPQRLDDQRLGAAEFGVGRAHLADQGGHQPPHHRLAGAHHVRVAHRPTHDPPQHVTAALVGRQHPVGHQEGRAAQMVGHHAMAGLERPVRLLPRDLRAGQDQGAKQIDVVVVVLALQHGGDALEAHAGVDRGARQRHAGAGRPLLVLHEDEVPDLDEPIAVLVGAARRPAGNLRAVVVEDLRTRAARSGVAHAPEIVGGGDADDPLLRQPGDPPPQRGRLLVVGEHGDRQLLLRQRELARHQRPGVLDRLLLEVVAEAEIAEHLEEGVMPGGVADIVEIVVLAAGAHAFLRGGGARRRGRPFLARKDVLELHHAAVDEQQRRVVARHQRR